VSKKNTKEKIIITAPYSKNGGVSSFIESVIPYFKKEVKVFYRGFNSEINRKSISSLLSILLPLRYVLAHVKESPDIAIINSSLKIDCLIRDGLLILLSKLFDNKVLLILHGFEEDKLKYKLILRIGYFQTDAIIVLASKFADQLKEVGFQKPIYTQFNPISTDFVKQVNNNKKDFWKGIRKFLFLSRIEKYKGIFTAIDAFRIVNIRYPETQLKIAGTGNALTEAKNFVVNQNINNVEFLGFVNGEQKSKLISECDVLLFPTEHNEGLPINVLEAMAAGQIILTRPVAGLKDLYAASNFGFILESVNPDDYSKVMCELIENYSTEYINIRQRNIEFAKKFLNPMGITQKIENIINHL
jgi:glycosyltransferase involved in cell wall biosynthesis